jgi:hypothetical protein
MSEPEKPIKGAVPCQVCFETIDGDYARLMIKLRNEELTKKEFFIAIIKGFLDDEPNLRLFLKAYRKGKGYAMWKEEVLDKEIEAGKVEMRKFGLEKDEIDDMYDMFDIEEEEAGL